MATIEIKGQSLCVTIEGVDKVLSLTSTLSVPLSHIDRIVPRPDLSRLMNMEVGTRVWGLHVGGTALMGTIVLEDNQGYMFCDVRDPTKAIALELEHDRYKKVIVELSNEGPDEARARIESAIAALPTKR